MKIVITGGAGFIGSAVIRHIIANSQDSILNIDKLTYAGNLENLREVEGSDRYQFVQADICNGQKMAELFKSFQPDAVMHLAAESHVDRSIDGPGDFIQTNIIGTYTLLETARDYWQELEFKRQQSFRFHHVSTDEVYGDLEGTENLFTEDTPYAPSSPYSASKASSDHLVRAWGRTYGLPVVISNCSNNYGPYQFPEKLIPLMILNALEGKALPVYGKGEQVRDWLYVEDHASALYLIIVKGNLGETYNVGGFNEKRNIDVIKALCKILEQKYPNKPEGVKQYSDLISFVTDRPGHDLRYAIDANKIKTELNWYPSETFESGLEKTVDWYLHNLSWCKHVQEGSYAGERLGMSK